MQPTDPIARDLKMSAPAEVQEQPRSHRAYKQDFLEQLLRSSPASVLDVGCGQAELLRALITAGCAKCTGIEPDESAVCAARDRGLDVRPGRAEALPFPDQSYEVVIFDYVAHHVEFLDRALLEAARVARRAVLVLDPWYDVSLPSQQVALDFDNWLKCIDRRRGLVHNPCVEAAQLAAPFRALGGFRIDYSHRLLLQAVPISKVEAQAREQLAASAHCPELEGELVRLLDRARLHGLTDDGALSFRASRQ